MHGSMHTPLFLHRSRVIAAVHSTVKRRRGIVTKRSAAESRPICGGNTHAHSSPPHPLSVPRLTLCWCVGCVVVVVVVVSVLASSVRLGLTVSTRREQTERQRPTQQQHHTTTMMGGTPQHNNKCVHFSVCVGVVSFRRVPFCVLLLFPLRSSRSVFLRVATVSWNPKSKTKQFQTKTDHTCVCVWHKQQLDEQTTRREQNRYRQTGTHTCRQLKLIPSTLYCAD